MSLYNMLFPLLAVTWAAAFAPALPRHHAIGSAVKGAGCVASIWQQATVQLKISPGAGMVSWPNNGVMPILTYAWGGDRPLPPIIAIDSSIVPRVGAARPPVLIVQRRKDVFSPLLKNLLDQNQNIPAIAITIKPATRKALSYLMWNAKVIGIRNVGQVIEENPVTEEIVLVFERLEPDSPDEKE